MFFLIIFSPEKMIEASLVILFVLSTLIGLLASYGGFTRFVFIFYLKMVVFHLSILLAAFCALFGTLITYFYNEVFFFNFFFGIFI